MEARYLLTGPVPIRSEAGSLCPPSLDWALLAAGNLKGERAEALLAHAAECEECGLTLRLATEAMSDELPAVAPAPVELARRLAGGEKVVEMPRRRWWALGATIAAALTLVVGGWTLRPAAGPTADVLLAQAYAERRPFDFRLPEAAFAPVRVVRSATLSRVKPLLEAEVQITERLAKDPRDVAALQWRARAEMLEFEPAAAVRSLQRALEVKPGDASLLADLGSAYAQQGLWNEAAEALTAALASRPGDAVALFNRALVNGRRGARAEAMADWDRYLTLDATSGWAAEAREHRQGLEHPPVSN